MNTERKGQCVACEASDLFNFYNVENVPVDTGTLPKSIARAKEAICGTLSLDFCRSCGTVHNRSFNPNLIQFSPGYDASLNHSPSLAKATADLADELVENYSLDGNSILEIGCGQAHLLKAICRRASVHAVGIDPTTIPFRDSILTSRIQLLQSRLNASHRDLVGDLVICVSVIEDIDEPLNFLRMLRSLIEDRGVSLYFELFDGFGAIESGQVWSPHYEQCNYFSQQAIEQLFQRADYSVTRSGRARGNDQYLFVAAEPGCDQKPLPMDLSHEQKAVENFASEAERSIHAWGKRLADWSAKEKRVSLWGSGGKAVSFLSQVAEADTIGAVVDVNPNRQGLYMPVSAQPVISPDDLTELRPDVLVMSNPAYRSEIETEVQRLGLDCELVAA